MEVCGGHTMAIHRYGIHSLLPENIELISGPGCPVCVTSQVYIDKIIEYAKMPGKIITIYGDLLRVPGTQSTLDQEKTKGCDIRIVQSSLDSIKIAEENKTKEIIFPAIGFETTTPATAIALLEAKKKGLCNFFVASAHKIMPPVMEVLIRDNSEIDGYIGPGHVSTIAGSKIYDKLVSDFGISIVVSGFEPIDILQSIYMLVKQIESNEPCVAIQYTRAVTHDGNLKAQQIVSEVFEPVTDTWRGLGKIEKSGLKLNAGFSSFDANKHFPVHIEEKPEPANCLCGQILRGINKPTDCKLFAHSCTPEMPIGACMVSPEGTCAAYYQYRNLLNRDPRVPETDIQ